MPAWCARSRARRRRCVCLTSYAGEIVRAAALTAPEMRGHVVAHLYDLIAMTIGATRDAAETARGRGVGAARLRAIKADIVEKLGRGDLTIHTIAAAHGISPRYVRALFDAEGTTFSDFVVERRLALAHRKLTDPHYVGHTISAIVRMRLRRSVLLQPRVSSPLWRNAVRRARGRAACAARLSVQSSVMTPVITGTQVPPM